jgi:hypothetical protein
VNHFLSCDWILDIEGLSGRGRASVRAWKDSSPIGEYLMRNNSKIGSFLKKAGLASMYVTVMLTVLQPSKGLELPEMNFSGNHLFNVTVNNGPVINGNVILNAHSATISNCNKQ